MDWCLLLIDNRKEFTEFINIFKYRNIQNNYPNLQYITKYILMLEEWIEFNIDFKLEIWVQRTNENVQFKIFGVFESQNLYLSWYLGIDCLENRIT